MAYSLHLYPVEVRPQGSDVAFVDGVRRIDARLVLDTDEGPVPGLCGSRAVGAVVWRREVPESEVISATVERIAVLAAGHSPRLPPLPPALDYRPQSVAETDPAALVRTFHDGMRRSEAVLTEELAQGGYFVVADGPLYEYTDAPKVGFIKSHRRSYLEGEAGSLIGRLPAGHRTPLFAIGEGRFRRYSWYIRLADPDMGPAWGGIARCEASAAPGLDDAVVVADRSASVLPLVASEPHIDPRAPQNLVPIAALERDLRHRMGDAGLAYRELRAAIAMAA